MHNYLLISVLLLAACGKDGAESKTAPTPPAGGVSLRMNVQSASSDLRFDWEDAPRALVNGTSCTVTPDVNGVPIINATAAADGNYTVCFPAEAYSRLKTAFILPPAQFSASGGKIAASSCPMYGTGAVSQTSGEIVVKPLCGILRLTLTGSANIQSVRIADKASQALAGTFPFNTSLPRIIQNDDPQNLSWVTLDCSQAGDGLPLSAAGTAFNLALPEGTYASGLTIRVTDQSHRAMTFEIPGPCALRAGAVKSLPAKAYAPDSDLLFAEYFDNCVWGCDYASEKGGYGAGAGSTTPSSATASGTEAAYVSKNTGTPGSALFEATDFTCKPATSTTLGVRRDYLRRRNLYDWERLFYAAEYQGCIAGGDLQSHNNRGILITPLLTNAAAPCYADLTFRICLERGMTGTVACLCEAGILLGAQIDGTPVDLGINTSRNISQNIQGVTRTALLLRPEQVTPGVWHTVTLSFGAISAGSSFRFMHTVVRNTNNCFWIDDLEIRHTAEYPLQNNDIVVEPTTAKGIEGADVSHLRLSPGSELSMGDNAAYTASPALGMKWVCPALPTDESLWATTVANAEKYLAQSGTKVWCIHVPYGPMTAARNRDLCATGSQRVEAVTYFTKCIHAVAPLHPANVLVHCNQTLAFDDGSSAESLAQSLHELQTVADGIGAHICVENMSYGVGADAAVLSKAVDEANAMGSHKYDVRIGMDTGHANLYLTRTQPGKTIVDWLRTAGHRIGHLHIHGNRGWKGAITDDHLTPGYTGLLGISDAIGAAKLWGEFYHVLLSDCRYRGPFNYEVGNKSFGKVDGEERYDNLSSPWHVFHNYNTYMYPAFREYIHNK